MVWVVVYGQWDMNRSVKVFKYEKEGDARKFKTEVENRRENERGWWAEIGLYSVE